MYAIEHNQFLRDALLNRQILQDFIKRILSVIYYTSKIGIVHGDLKPENILVSYDDLNKRITDCKIIDFGTS